MKATRRIRTMVISVPADTDTADASLADSSAPRPRFRPSDLLPWSDPYIAGLVRKLQDDIRSELAPSEKRIVAEADMPWNEPFEYELDDELGFAVGGEFSLRN